MTEPGTRYRLKAADMFAKAEETELYREDYERLAKSFLRLAELADHNAQTDLPHSETQQPQESEQQEPRQSGDKD